MQVWNYLKEFVCCDGSTPIFTVSFLPLSCPLSTMTQRDASMGVQSAAVSRLEPPFAALLIKEKVPENFIEWLVSDGVEVTSVRAFAACATAKDKVDDSIINASGVTFDLWQQGLYQTCLGSGCELIEFRPREFGYRRSYFSDSVENAGRH